MPSFRASPIFISVNRHISHVNGLHTGTSVGWGSLSGGLHTRSFVRQAY